MKKLSAMKDLERDILSPMKWVHRPDPKQQNGGAVGQATQLVVGAADESDVDILDRVDQLYDEWNLKRVYYAPFHPVRHTPLEEHPATPPMRSHRLYQIGLAATNLWLPQGRAYTGLRRRRLPPLRV